MFDFIFEHNLNKNGYFDSVEKRNNLAFTLEILSEQIMYQFLKDLKDREVLSIPQPGFFKINVRLFIRCSTLACPIEYPNKLKYQVGEEK